MILRIIRLLVQHCLYIEEYGNHIQNGSHTCCGVCQILGFEGKTSRVGSEPPRATSARDEATQWVASSWHIRCPNERTQHPQASYLSLDQEVSFTPLRVGWHRAV
jgi:hypothetical protein